MYTIYIKKIQILIYFYFFIFLFSVPKPSYCQTTNYEFIGSLLYNNMKEHVVYKVVFTEVNGAISGYSITDLGGKYETKTAIKGLLNKKNGKISFNETKIISTKYKQDESNLCFVNAKCALKNVDKKTLITGNFNGYYLKDKQLCASGKVMLISSKNLYQDLLKTMNSLPENNLKDSIRKTEKRSKKKYGNILKTIKARIAEEKYNEKEIEMEEKELRQALRKQGKHKEDFKHELLNNLVDKYRGKIMDDLVDLDDELYAKQKEKEDKRIAKEVEKNRKKKERETRKLNKLIQKETAARERATRKAQKDLQKEQKKIAKELSRKTKKQQNNDKTKK